jgi:hypothetical protein
MSSEFHDDGADCTVMHPHALYPFNCTYIFPLGLRYALKQLQYNLLQANFKAHKFKASNRELTVNIIQVA